VSSSILSVYYMNSLVINMTGSATTVSGLGLVFDENQIQFNCSTIILNTRKSINVTGMISQSTNMVQLNITNATVTCLNA